MPERAFRHPEVRAERASKDAAEVLNKIGLLPSPFEGRCAAASG
jgi:hypothetical protein